MCWLPVDADGDQGVDGDYGGGVLDSEDDGAEPWSEHPPPQHESEQKMLINRFVQLVEIESFLVNIYLRKVSYSYAVMVARSRPETMQ